MNRNKKISVMEYFSEMVPRDRAIIKTEQMWIFLQADSAVDTWE